MKNFDEIIIKCGSLTRPYETLKFQGTVAQFLKLTSHADTPVMPEVQSALVAQGVANLQLENPERPISVDWTSFRGKQISGINFGKAAYALDLCGGNYAYQAEGHGRFYQTAWGWKYAGFFSEPYIWNTPNFGWAEAHMNVQNACMSAAATKDVLQLLESSVSLLSRDGLEATLNERVRGDWGEQVYINAQAEIELIVGSFNLAIQHYDLPILSEGCEKHNGAFSYPNLRDLFLQTEDEMRDVERVRDFWTAWDFAYQNEDLYANINPAKDAPPKERW